MKRQTFVILIILVGLTVSSVAQLPHLRGFAQGRPNIVVILTDDLDAVSVTRMPTVKRLLMDRGVTFQRFFATTPLCCPSRSSILRGQYAHNHGVLRNTGDDGGFDAFRDKGNEHETLATLLDDTGYETALIGKYLNGYSRKGEDPTYIPPGWDYWVAGINNDAYKSFNYTLNVNGTLEDHGDRGHDYMTDVLAGRTFEFLDQALAGSQPFFLYLAPYAPHSPATPAPRDEGKFRHARAPRTPAFNESNVRDKPRWIQGAPRLSKEDVKRVDETYQRRLESLMGVDDLVGDLVTRLQAAGALDSTYILFLSDNGFFLGEHRQPNGKDAPYDPATMVPLVIRGPDVVAGLKVDQIALNIDLLPTIADLASLRAPSFVDGRSLRPLLRGEDPPWRKVALLEGFGRETESNDAGEPPTPAFQALRGTDVLYIEYETGERELYNVRRDPAQLVNLAGEAPRPLLRTYSSQLAALAGCAAQDCQQLEDASLPAPPKNDPRRPHTKKESAHKRGQAVHKQAQTGHKQRQKPHQRGKANHRR